MSEDVYVVFNESEVLVIDILDNEEAAEKAHNTDGLTVWGPYDVNSEAGKYIEE